MSAVPSSSSKVQIESVQFRSAASESTMQTIGGICNYAIDSIATLNSTTADHEARLDEIETHDMVTSDISGDTHTTLTTSYQTLFSAAITVSSYDTDRVIGCWLEPYDRSTDSSYFSSHIDIQCSTSSPTNYGECRFDVVGPSTTDILGYGRVTNADFSTTYYAGSPVNPMQVGLVGQNFGTGYNTTRWENVRFYGANQGAGTYTFRWRAAKSSSLNTWTCNISNMRLRIVKL